jgi:linoleoyl-CoA desaturase
MLLAVATLGVTLAVVFQLAHCVEEAAFHDAHRAPPAGDWAAHQVATTVDFARGNRPLGWYVGGLNYQIEHHLFPRVSHLHYPGLAPLVEAACRDHGIRYRVQPSLLAALRSNVRWLRQLGRLPRTSLRAA